MLAGIGASVALAVGCVGMFVLTPSHHVASGNQAGSSAVADTAHPGPTPTPSPGKSSSKPSPSHKPHKHKAHHAAPHKAPLPRVAAANVFVGVAVNGSVRAGVHSFTQATGAQISVVEVYSGFGDPFPGLQAHRILSTGASPLIQWNPRRTPIRQIANGKYNSYLRKYAATVKKFGHGLTLSFGHEMNGPWSEWGAGHVSPATFVRAWRRIHNVFASAGVHNVSWSWDPSHTGEEPHPWWPGSAYVDKIGIDGYQRPGQTFADIFAARLADIRSFASKPIFIAETAVAPSAGQARQVVGLFAGVEKFNLTGFVWFNINHLEAWRLEGRAPAERAFRKSVTAMHGG